MKSLSKYAIIYFMFIKTIFAVNELASPFNPYINAICRSPIIEYQYSYKPFFIYKSCISISISVNLIKYSDFLDPYYLYEPCFGKKVSLNAAIKIACHGLDSTDNESIKVFNKIKKLRFDSYTHLKYPGLGEDLLFPEKNKNSITSRIYDLKLCDNCETVSDSKSDLLDSEVVAVSSSNKNILLNFWDRRTTFAVRFLDEMEEDVFVNEDERLSPILLCLSLFMKRKQILQYALSINFYDENEYIEVEYNYKKTYGFQVGRTYNILKAN